jgi:alkanesulfonate monooxygenase SsuD/methylene tetrahydromethanopterin reductase-like flavin-dependent oxidoreductase (luciferase family)
MFDDMKFTMCASPDASLPKTIEWWQLIDRLGFDYIGIPDTPMLMREAYVSLTAAALATSRAGIKLMVTNPLTRDVSVTAGAMLALRDLIGDRLVVGFGAGDSASKAIGLGKANAAQIADYIVALRGLISGERVNFQGRELKAAWRDWTPWRPHLMMAGAGEKTFRTAGRVADAVISAFGLLPELIAQANEWIRQGAEEVGRDPAQIDVWHMVLAVPGATRDEAFAHATALGSLLAHNGNPRAKLIPPEMEPGLWEMAKHYSLESHSRDNAAILEIGRRTGCIDYLVARGGMIGPVDYVELVQKYRSYGAKNLIFTALGPDRPATVQKLADTVLRQRAASQGQPSLSTPS